MELIKLTKNNLDEVVAQSAEILKKDGIVVFPSDTVYGLAANALSSTAIDKLLAFKNRPKGKAISIAVSSIEQIETYAQIEKRHLLLIQTLLPGPFTLALSSKHTVDTRLEAEDGTIGIRVPDNQFVRMLTHVLADPITATSANISGKGPHYSIDALLHTLSQKKKDMLSLVIDAGPLPHNLPSTVLNMTHDNVPVLRQGSIMVKNHKTFLSTTEQETKNIAEGLVHKYEKLASRNSLFFILKGELGTGKTVFTKGVGTYLNVKETIVSPTYVVYYEYSSHKNPFEKLHHFDLYQVDTIEELEVLGIPQLLMPHQMIVMEWGERLGALMPVIAKSNAKIVLILFSDIDEHTRMLDVYEIN